MTTTYEIDSPIGTLLLSERDGCLVGLTTADHAGPVGEPRSDPAGSVAAGPLGAYFDGDLDALERIPVATAGTPFQEEVWATLRGIPAGTTISYRELADRVGRPAASRAVGQANGANPVWLVNPCHRVIAADGGLGGYGGGIDRKAWLLRHEGVPL